MTLIAIGLLATLFSSLVFYAAAHLLSWLYKPAYYAPILWGAVLVGPLFVPLIAVLLTQIPTINGMTLQTGGIGQTGGVIWNPAYGLSGIVMETAQTAQQTIPSWVLVALYTIGAGIALFRLAWGRFQVRRILRSASGPLRIGQHTIWRSEKAPTAFAWQATWPGRDARIILPSEYFDRFNAIEIDQITKHEARHIARCDDRNGLLLRIACAVLWASPFSAAAFSHWVESIELSCDREVLNGQPHKMRKAYAATVLKALHITANRVRQYPAASFSTQRLRNEKMRITHIMTPVSPIFKRAKTKLALLSAAASLALAGGFGLSGFAGADPADRPVSKVETITLGNIVTGRLTSPFGKRANPFDDSRKHMHWGLDIAGPEGTPIRAPANGTVLVATDLYNDNAKYGKVLVIETADQTETLFSHLQSYSFSVGDTFKKGDILAAIGNTGESTGPHVHIETRQNGNRVDPATIWSIAD